MKKQFNQLTSDELKHLLADYQATARKTSYGWCVDVPIKEFYVKQNKVGVIGDGVSLAPESLELEYAPPMEPVIKSEPKKPVKAKPVRDEWTLDLFGGAA